MLSSLLLSTQGVQAAAKGSSGDKPNFVFIFTDDQDSQLDSLDYMPNLQKHLVKEGTLYENHYATIAVCCPSRVSLLRGQYAHNTKYVSCLIHIGLLLIIHTADVLVSRMSVHPMEDMIVSSSLVYTRTTCLYGCNEYVDRILFISSC